MGKKGGKKFPAAFKKCDEPSRRPGERQTAVNYRDAVRHGALVRGSLSPLMECSQTFFKMGGGRVFHICLSGRQAGVFFKVEAPF